MSPLSPETYYTFIAVAFIIGFFCGFIFNDAEAR